MIIQPAARGQAPPGRHGFQQVWRAFPSSTDSNQAIGKVRMTALAIIKAAESLAQSVSSNVYSSPIIAEA